MNRITIIKVLEGFEIADYFSDEGYLYELINVYKETGENNDDLARLIDEKFISMIQLRMLNKHNVGMIVNRETIDDIPEIKNALFFTHEDSEDFYEFKVRVHSSLDGIISILSKRI